MNTGYIPRLSLDGAGKSLQADFTGFVQKIQSPQQVEGSNFKDTLGNLLQNIDGVMSAPDALMKDSMTTGSVDVHDVMIANAKAELLVNVTAQVATKVSQAYDRLLQIQI